MDYTNQLNEVNENLEIVQEILGNIRDNSYFQTQQLQNIEYKMTSGDQITMIKEEMVNIETRIELVAMIGILFIIYYFIMRCLK